ncbi:MAG: hypothetical protein JKX81_03875 [Arenicella sp.]|nr:hypothetical protein [Arenicella sp.]
MDDYLSGVMSVGGQKYALPLTEIDSIESSYQIKVIDDSPFLEVDDKGVAVYDLDENHNVLEDKRRLCVVIGDIALMADEFESRQLDKRHLRAVPTLVDTGVVAQLYFSTLDNEFIQILRMSSLPSYLAGEQRPYTTDS